ncbi:hypothetical protein MKW98_027782, partial [Papaver atlanticum]
SMVGSSIALGKKRAGICSENMRQQFEKCSRRKFTETNLNKDKLDRNKQSYSREEREVLRFENSYQQRQIWREIYTGLGLVVAKQLNLLAEARQNGKAIADQQQQQQHHQYPQQQQQHPRQRQQHHHYKQKSQQHQQQHHRHPKKPSQHHHNYHQHQLAGVHRESTSIL